MREQGFSRRRAYVLTSWAALAGSLVWASGLGACSSFSADGDAVADAGGADVVTDTSPRGCDTNGLFEGPVPVDSINDPLDTSGARLTPDELTVYFSSTRAASPDLYVATRASTTASFGSPRRLDKLSSVTLTEDYPSISADGRTFFFSQAELTGTGSYGVFFATVDAAGAFSAPSKLVEGAARDFAPFVASNGDVYFASDARTGFSFDIYRLARKASAAFEFEPRELLATVSSEQSDSAPVLSVDGLTMYLASTRTGSLDQDIWVARRPTQSAEFGAAERVGGLSSDNEDVPTWLSPDNCRLYLTSKRGGGARKVYLATRVPPR